MDFVPKGPIWRTGADSETQEYYGRGRESIDRQRYLTEIASWRESASEEAYATARLSPEINAVQEYVQCLQGGGWWDRRRAKYKSRFYDNRLNNSRQSDLALLTDTRPTISVSSQIEAYKQQADMASKAIQSEWTMRNMDLSLVTTTDITKLTGTGFWKIGACSPGQMSVVPCGPENVLPIQPGFDIQQSSAVLYRTWKNISYFRNKFPFSSVGLEREANFSTQQTSGDGRFNRPSEIPEVVWNGISNGMKRLLGVQSSSSDMGTYSMFSSLELQEYYIDDPTINESPNEVLMRHPYLSLKQHNYWYWVKPGQRLYPRKRLVVFAGRRVMYDGPAPFWHGQYPFACMRLNPVPWSFWGQSKYRDLLPLNRAINDIGAGMLDMIQRCLNPVMATVKNRVADSMWKEFYPNMPGAKLMLMPNASVNDIKYLDPPPIPSYVIHFLQYLTTEFDRLAGAIDVNSLGKKKQVPGGDTIEQMRELMNSITRLEGRYIEKFLEDAGVQATSNFFQFFELPVRLRMLGKDGISWEDFNSESMFSGPNLIPDNVPKEDHWRSYATKIGVGSLLGSSKDRDKQMAINLASHGLAPLRFLYQTLDLPDPDGMLVQLAKEHEDGIGASGGQKPRGTRGQKNGKAA